MVALATDLVEPGNHSLGPGAGREVIGRDIDARGTCGKRRLRAPGTRHEGTGLGLRRRFDGRLRHARRRAHEGETLAKLVTGGNLRRRILANGVGREELFLEEAARLGTDAVHRREGHAAAIVHLDVERDGLEGTLAHAADVLDEIPGAHRPRTGGFYDEAVRSRGCRPVLSEELHREGLTDAGDHAHRHATPAGNVPRGGARRGVHGPLRANHAHRGARRQGTRGAAADRLARGSVNLGVDGQELRGVIERTKLEKVALPHRGRQSQGHVGTGEAAHALATAVAATATDEGVLELVGRDDLAHQLASIVRPLVAHHVVVGGTEEIGVGEVAVERPSELAMAQGGQRVIVDAGGQRVEGTSVRGDHGVHIVGSLHATLDLDRAHARVAHPGEIVNGAEVLGAERPGATGRRDHLARLVDEVVRQTARLRAETAIRRATARERAHHADARVAEAERPMAKAL